MKRHNEALFVMILLYASLSFLPATSFAESAEILRFEPGDTLSRGYPMSKHLKMYTPSSSQGMPCPYRLKAGVVSVTRRMLESR